MSYLVNRPAQNDVSDLQTLSGVPDGSTNLGTFTGNTVRDNPTVKEAVQDLETEVEDRSPDFVQWKKRDGGYFFGSTSAQMISEKFFVSGARNWTYFFDIEIPSNSASFSACNQRTDSANSKFFISITTTELQFIVRDSSGQSYSVTTPLSSGVHTYAVTCVNGTLLSLYKDGELVDSESLTGPGVITFITSGSFYALIGGGSGFSGFEAKSFNRALTAAEVARYSRGEPPRFSDVVTSLAAVTSGTLVDRKRYRILSYVAGDNFTNIGASSNASGVEFIATGSTPTTWTNGSSLEMIGQVSSYQPESSASGIWADVTPLGNNASISGAVSLFEKRLYANAFLMFLNAPTSSAGLPAGRVWRDGNDLKIV